MTIQANVVEALSSLRDPFLQLTAQEMHLQHTLLLSDSHLQLDLLAGFPCHSLQTSFLPLLQSSLQQQLPELTCQVGIQPHIETHKTQMPGKSLRGIKNTIAIASGKGGVGKSTVTVNLALALAAEGARVGILDADIYGPSIPLMLGKKTEASIREDHYLPVEAHGLYTMSIGYLSDNNQALIWRGPMLAKALIQMLDSTRWDNLDYLLIDLPPGTGDIPLSLVQKIPLTAAIVVTTPQNVATLDAQKGLQLFATTGIEVLGLIENMSLHQCTHCGHEEAIFGSGGAAALCQNHNTTLLGQLPLEAHIRESADKGEPKITEAFLKTALRSAIALAARPLNYGSSLADIPVMVERTN